MNERNRKQEGEWKKETEELYKISSKCKEWALFKREKKKDEAHMHNPS